MVQTCSAYGCNETYVRDGPYSFHCFPKDSFRRTLWLLNMRGGDFSVKDHSVICSKHFAVECFDKNKLGGHWLNKDAVPTLFATKVPPKKKTEAIPKSKDFQNQHQTSAGSAFVRHPSLLESTSTKVAENAAAAESLSMGTICNEESWDDSCDDIPHTPSNPYPIPILEENLEQAEVPQSTETPRAPLNKLRDTLLMFRKTNKKAPAPSATARAAACIEEEHAEQLKCIKKEEARKEKEHELRMELLRSQIEVTRAEIDVRVTQKKVNEKLLDVLSNNPNLFISNLLNEK